MKKILTLIAILAIYNSVNAQAYEQGNNSVKVWVGFAPTLTATSGGFGFNVKNSLPIAVSYERGISDRISIGFFAGTTSSKMVDADGDGFKNSYLVIGGRGSYHFATAEKFDPYVGLMIAYNKVSVSDVGTGFMSFGTVAASGILPGAYLGANYYITDNLGINGEVGYGVAAVNLGIAIKF